MTNEGWRTLRLGNPESQGETPSPKGTLEPRSPEPGLPVILLFGWDSSSRPSPARRFQGEENQVVATALGSGRK